MPWAPPARGVLCAPWPASPFPCAELSAPLTGRLCDQRSPCLGNHVERKGSTPATSSRAAWGRRPAGQLRSPVCSLWRQQVVPSIASIPSIPRITVGSPVEPRQYAGRSSSQNQTGSAFVGRPDVWSTPSRQCPWKSSLCLAAMRCAADLVLDGSVSPGHALPGNI